MRANSSLSDVIDKYFRCSSQNEDQLSISELIRYLYNSPFSDLSGTFLFLMLTYTGVLYIEKNQYKDK